MSLSVLVVDDEPLARERVAELAAATVGLELAGLARNGVEALDLIASERPDLVLLDVEMPGLTGFEVVTALDRDALPGVIFVTAYDHYAVKAFDVGAIDYLLKPVTKARFAEAIERARERLASARAREAERQRVHQAAVEATRSRGPRARYAVRSGHHHRVIAVDAIDWIEAADNYLKLHVGDKAHLVRGTITEAERELSAERFARIHRSTLVAIDRIERIRRTESGAWTIELRSGPELRVSRSYLDRIRQLLGRGRSGGG
ncbi:MAG: LytR/AlgR family response regulator transcription factor [Gemmatimonadales bacterium]